MKCIHCGADKSKHIPAANGGLDCPPREDGKELMIVALGSMAGATPADPDVLFERREWRDPEPKTPLDVLRLAAAGGEPDEPGGAA